MARQGGFELIFDGQFQLQRLENLALHEVDLGQAAGRRTGQTLSRTVTQLQLAKSTFGNSKIFFAQAAPGPIRSKRLKEAIGVSSDVLILGAFIELATEIVGIFGSCH